MLRLLNSCSSRSVGMIRHEPRDFPSRLYFSLFSHCRNHSYTSGSDDKNQNEKLHVHQVHQNSQQSVGALSPSIDSSLKIKNEGIIIMKKVLPDRMCHTGARTSMHAFPPNGLSLSLRGRAPSPLIAAILDQAQSSGLSDKISPPVKRGQDKEGRVTQQTPLLGYAEETGDKSLLHDRPQSFDRCSISSRSWLAGNLKLQTETQHILSETQQRIESGLRDLASVRKALDFHQNSESPSSKDALACPPGTSMRAGLQDSTFLDGSVFSATQASLDNVLERRPQITLEVDGTSRAPTGSATACCSPSGSALKPPSSTSGSGVVRSGQSSSSRVSVQGSSAITSTADVDHFDVAPIIGKVGSRAKQVDYCVEEQVSVASSRKDSPPFRPPPSARKSRAESVPVSGNPRKSTNTSNAAAKKSRSNSISSTNTSSRRPRTSENQRTSRSGSKIDTSRKETSSSSTKTAKTSGIKKGKMPAAANAEPAANPNLRKTGQHTFKSGKCIATNLDGTPCMEPFAHAYVPYCKNCLKKGDPSLGVTAHPRFGRMLYAKRALPENYLMALWGDVQTEEEIPDEDDEWGFETHDGMNINPVKHEGSILQFSQCPGPHERTSIAFANPYLHMEPMPGKGKKRVEKYAAMMFRTVRPVPKNYQLNMMYAGSEKETIGFFEERGLTRCDVWTSKHPTFLRKNATVDMLMCEPPKAKSVREEIQVVKQSKNKPKSGGWNTLNLNDPLLADFQKGLKKFTDKDTERLHKRELQLRAGLPAKGGAKKAVSSSGKSNKKSKTSLASKGGAKKASSTKDSKKKGVKKTSIAAKR